MPSIGASARNGLLCHTLLRLLPLLIEKFAAHCDAMIALTRELIAIPSENPPGNCYRETVELLSRRLGELGFTDTRIQGDCILSFAGQGERAASVALAADLFLKHKKLYREA